MVRSVEAQSFQETGHLSVTLHSLAKRNESKWSGLPRDCMDLQPWHELVSNAH